MGTRSTAAILLITMLPQLTSCATWRVQQVSPADAISRVAADTLPHDVRVRLRQDNITLVIQKAGIVGDSIVGYLLQDWAASGGPRHRVAVALGDVKEVDISELSPGKTLLLIAGFGALLAAGAIVANNARWGTGISWR